MYRTWGLVELQVRSMYKEYFVPDTGWSYKHDKVEDRINKAKSQNRELEKAELLA